MEMKMEATKPTVKTDRFEIWNGKSEIALPLLPSNRYDALVTDPPAGISFLGRDWDHHKGGRDQWIAWLSGIMAEAFRVMKPGAYGLVWGLPKTSHWTGMALENVGFQPQNVIAHLFGSGFPKNALSQLKPAMEFWWLVQKPLDGTILGNVEKWGCGALNIDDCRIPTNGEHLATFGTRTASSGGILNATAEIREPFVQHPLGRWPSNVIHDGSEEVMAEFAMYGESATKRIEKPCDFDGKSGFGGKLDGGRPARGHTDSGSVARFFYCAKPSPSERQDNPHPTVKSLALMSYLCRLITPPGGHILDCFAGSFTTGEAALQNGFNFTGIEQDADYCAYGLPRLESASGQFSTRQFGGLFQHEPHPTPKPQPVTRNLDGDVDRVVLFEWSRTVATRWSVDAPRRQNHFDSVHVARLPMAIRVVSRRCAGRTGRN
jgi:site-specific DNA-methyltransferase (adenine-specific)